MRKQFLCLQNNSMENPHLDYGLHLNLIELLHHGKHLSNYRLPDTMLNWNEGEANIHVQDEPNFDLQIQQETFDTNHQKLNPRQREIFERITTAINTDSPAAFFLQGSAGTGKTFLYSVICNYYRAQGKIVLCVASSGIASLLLPGRRTAHSRSKIPLILDDHSVCNISKNSPKADLIEFTSLIIWYEVTMQHRQWFEAVHRTFCDIMGVSNDIDCIFGNIPMLMGGDWAEILPVVKHGTRPQIIHATLQSFFLWHKIQVLFLKDNMRVIDTPEYQAYADYLSKMS